MKIIMIISYPEHRHPYCFRFKNCRLLKHDNYTKDDSMMILLKQIQNLERKIFDINGNDITYTMEKNSP